MKAETFCSLKANYAEGVYRKVSGSNYSNEEAWLGQKTVLILESLAESVDDGATVIIQDWHTGQSCLLYPSIASG